MSKLIDMYKNLKQENLEIIYLFKNGIFYIALDNDAIKLSNLFGLKLTNLNDSIKKCGFPCSSIDKYLSLFKSYNLNIRLIEHNKNVSYSVENFKKEQCINDIILEIKNADVEHFSISEAYSFIENLQKKFKNL